MVKLLDKARRAVTKAEKSVDTAKDARLAAQGVLDRANAGLNDADKELAEAIAEKDVLDLRKAAALVKRTGVAVGPCGKAPAPVVAAVEKPSVVLEQQISIYGKRLEAAAEKRRSTVARLKHR